MPRPPLVVIAPDSFKGSLSAREASMAIERGFRRAWPDAILRLCPMADGGEGTLDAVLSLGGERATARVANAAGLPIDAAYGLVAAGTTAVIEVAQIVGITDGSGIITDVELRSTRGVGQLMRALLDRGVRRFMIGLGGSSTNDGGAGMLAALGLDLRGTAGVEIDPVPRALASIAAVDACRLDPRLALAQITIMSDVDNPLCGPRGATAVFGPQKGVTVDRIAALDAQLDRFARLVESALGRAVRARPGAGAAGGLGFALQLLGGEVHSGAEVVADLMGLDAALDGADWLITGEGRSDAQTLSGKTPLVAARHALAQGVPATLISGAIDRAALPDLGRHFAGCLSITFGPATLAASIADSAELLADAAEQAARLFEAGSRQRRAP